MTEISCSVSVRNQPFSVNKFRKFEFSDEKTNFTIQMLEFNYRESRFVTRYYRDIYTQNRWYSTNIIVCQKYRAIPGSSEYTISNSQIPHACVVTKKEEKTLLIQFYYRTCFLLSFSGICPLPPAGWWNWKKAWMNTMTLFCHRYWFF